MSSSPIANKKSRQYSIRLPWGVSNAVGAFASQHRIAANRAIIELLERGLNAPNTADELQQPSALERLEALEALVQAQREALEALKARGTTKTSSREKRAIPGDPGAYLGQLCPKGHNWHNSGQSRRSMRNHTCMACDAEAAKGRRRGQRKTIKVEDA